MEDCKYKIITTDGAELDLDLVDFKKKVAILSFDSLKIDISKHHGAQKIVTALYEEYGASGVIVIDRNFDLLAMGEEDLGMHPKLAKQFLTNIAKRARVQTVKPPGVEVEALKLFHKIFRKELNYIYTGAVRESFLYGFFMAMCIFTNTEGNWVPAAAGFFIFAIYCTVEYRIRNGDYEQKAEKKAGSQIAGGSFPNDDYL